MEFGGNLKINNAFHAKNNTPKSYNKKKYKIIPYLRAHN